MATSTIPAAIAPGGKPASQSTAADTYALRNSAGFAARTARKLWQRLHKTRPSGTHHAEPAPAPVPVIDPFDRPPATITSAAHYQMRQQVWVYVTTAWLPGRIVDIDKGLLMVVYRIPGAHDSGITLAPAHRVIHQGPNRRA